jgi:hypothetical protein
MSTLLIVANDRVVSHLLRFLASARHFAAGHKILIVPFNEDDRLCRGVAGAFGIEVFDRVVKEIDAFGLALFEKNIPQLPFPYMLGKLRKLSLFAVEGPAVYVDLDVILTQPWDDMAGYLDGLDHALGYVVQSPEWVYNDSDESMPLRTRSKLFSSGVVAKGHTSITLPGLIEYMLSVKDFYHRVRVQGVVDQPLLNFLADTLETGNVVNLQHGLGFSCDITPQPWLHAKADWTVWSGDLKVPLLHVPGVLKNGMSCKFLFDAMLMRALEVIRDEDWDLFNELFRAAAWW